MFFFSSSANNGYLVFIYNETVNVPPKLFIFQFENNFNTMGISFLLYYMHLNISNEYVIIFKLDHTYRQ